MFRTYSYGSHKTTRGSAGIGVQLSLPFRLLRLVLVEWPENVRQRRALGDLNDHLLRDIGVTRDDVRLELCKPFWK